MLLRFSLQLRRLMIAATLIADAIRVTIVLTLRCLLVACFVYAFAALMMLD